MVNKYCVDANVLIEAWQKYYSPKICPNYWEVLYWIGNTDIIFIPELVFEEIIRTEDDLSKWLKNQNTYSEDKWTCYQVSSRDIL